MAAVEAEALNNRFVSRRRACRVRGASEAAELARRQVVERGDVVGQPSSFGLVRLGFVGKRGSVGSR